MGVQGKGTRFSGRSFFGRPFFSRSFFGGSWGKGRSGSKLRASAKAAVPLISVFTLGACAIHPLQQDVTGVPTVDLVNHIRCETRLAIQDKAIAMLRAYKDGQDGRTAYLAEYLSGIRGKPWRVNPNKDLADAKERAFYFRYINTGIAYDITFDVSEENKAALMADPVRLITNGMAGVGLNSSGDFLRNNQRHFIMSDTFGNLLADARLDCIDGTPNYAYPIAGKVGIGELISTFIDLNEDRSLQDLASGNSRVFADTLTFTTTLIGGVTPSVQINPVGQKWGLASPTNFAATVTRTDRHMMIVGLSMDVPKSTVKVAGVPFIAATAKSALQKSSVASPAEQSALDAVQQQRLDSFLNRFGTLAPAQ
jgi:hypothetical protein